MLLGKLTRIRYAFSIEDKNNNSASFEFYAKLKERHISFKEVIMGKIGEYEKTIVAEPLQEPLPVEKQVPGVPEPAKKQNHYLLR
jgi:hypothetical protein